MHPSVVWPVKDAMPAFAPHPPQSADDGVAPAGVRDAGRATLLEGASPININRLDLASIRLVVFCAKSGSLSEAARRCHLSLSGASHRLKSFEEAIGQPVFHRHRRGMRLTLAGQQIVLCGEQLLEWIERLAHQARREPG